MEVMTKVQDLLIQHLAVDLANILVEEQKKQWNRP